ncbi:unnamed protein product [Lupinus luteus]|uniref:Uncharacterized protein n=1 Tax=Lupinus luteus TaxID=3873 RepID=A0AAV1XHD3_LUPLU
MKHNAKSSPSDRDKGSIRAKHVHGNESKGDSGDGKECHFIEEMGNNLVCEDNAVVPANTLSKLLALEESLETDGTAASEGKQNKKGKQHRKISLPLLRFLDKKKKGWNNLKAKMRLSEVRRKVSSWRSVRILSKVLVIRLKLKMVRSLIKRKVRKQCKQDFEEKGDELCKKRILMGVRCKPLSSTGTLRYDEDGIFLPEITSFTSTPSHHC